MIFRSFVGGFVGAAAPPHRDHRFPAEVLAHGV